MINLGYKHDYIIDLIKTKIANNDIFHALLIYGEPGVGKTFLSNEICKILLNGDSNKSDKYENTAFTGLRSPDLYILGNNTAPNSNIITVDEIRKIKQWMSFTVLKSKYKVLLINDADRMNINANNAFLKILEEPIGNTIILLNTSKIGMLPLTLKSRCIKLKLRRKNIEKFIKILSDMFPHRENTEFEELYSLCHGNINLAAYIIESNLFDLSTRLNSEVKILEYMSQLNLESVNDLKLFNHLMNHFSSKVVNKKISNNQQINSSFFSRMDKIEDIFSNIHYLNKTHSKELIISILRECVSI